MAKWRKSPPRLFKPKSSRQGSHPAQVQGPATVLACPTDVQQLVTRVCLASLISRRPL